MSAPRSVSALFTLLLACSLSSPSLLPAQQNNQPPEEFRALFNGKDLSGWHAMASMDPRELARMSPEQLEEKHAANLEDMQAHWTVEDGELVNDGAGLYLTTDEEFENIELFIDYKTVPKADSGVYLRGTPQVQIWDYTEEGGKWNIGADKGSGGLYNNRPGSAGKDPLVLADRPFGQWNRLHIIQVGARTTVYLNDQLVVDRAIMHNYWDRDRPLFRTGPIQLQTHGGEIRWKNIFVREIPWDEALERLRQADLDGFQSVFNGENLEGWAGALESYEVKDGAIACKFDRGGTIYTKQPFADFSVRTEFQLPPGGNNGLAIRYPGQGDAAYVGMCELQVLDNTHPKYASLDPRQYHGSAYGMVAATRGYLRPVGQWNYQRVDVEGSHIRVELNGYVILDADLSTVSQYMADRPHPGKDRKDGHFGLAGHSDPVKFRNIAIRSD